MEDFTEPVTLCSPNESACLKEKNRNVAEAVGSLPHALKLTVLLYYYDSLSYQEIATITGCSTRGIESRLYRARKILANRLLPPQTLDSSSSALHGSERLPV